MSARAVVLLALIRYCLTLSEVDTNCLQANKKPLENANLLGKWYVIINFNPAISLDYCSCPTLEFSPATARDLSIYRDKYNVSAPYSLKDDPILLKGSKGLIDGAVFGKNEAKFYVLSPTSPMRQHNGYTVQVYRKINKDYALMYDCQLRQRFIKLLSRRRDVRKEELERVIENLTIVKDLEREILCRNNNCYFGI